MIDDVDGGRLAGQFESHQSIGAVPARELRKQVLAALQSFLGAKPVNLGGGGWEYSGNLDGSPVTIEIDCGSSSAQLHYGVSLKGLRAGTTFETILGVARGMWDVITEDNVADSMVTLTEFVRYLHELPGRLPAWQ